jgi:hypothetical protein
VNLRWSGTLRRFEAEFSADFQGDLAAVKAAGFKPDTSSGAWVWWTGKSAALTKLRENKPASGLTITAEARAQYTPLAAMDAKNAEVKAALKKHQKEQKKTPPKDSMKLCDLGFACISREDLPSQSCLVHPYTPPPPPETKCLICETPIYFYEKQDPPTCLWCEVTVLDNPTII